MTKNRRINRVTGRGRRKTEGNRRRMSWRRRREGRV